ncbi:MAG: metallophosphoesterase [Balneolaceae bacterium]
MPWSLRMTLITAGLMTVFLLYISSRYFWSVRMTNLQPQWALHGGMVGLILLFWIYPGWSLITYYAGYTYSLHDFAPWMKYLFWYGFVFAGVMLSWTLLLDITAAVIKFGFKVNPPQLNTFLGWAMISITVLVLVYTGLKIIWDTHRIKHIDVSYSMAEHGIEDMEPFRIIHISDLHADKYTLENKTDRYVQMVQKANPDLVFFTGDLVTAGMEFIESGADALFKIEATYGTFAVLGDHDYWSGADEITHALEERGIRVLRDENHWIEHAGEQIKLTGFTEIYSTRPESEIIDRLMAEDRGEKMRILFSHQASERLIEKALEENVHQLLAGHTHGGQIRIPFFFYPMTASLMETRYIRRDSWLGSTLLNVNSGLGFTLAPIRYNAPAEVTVIDVR